MHLAFTRGGRKAIDKVMKNNPAIFLKLLVLLVPREMKVEHAGGVKAMTDEQLEAGRTRSMVRRAVLRSAGRLPPCDRTPQHPSRYGVTTLWAHFWPP